MHRCFVPPERWQQDRVDPDIPEEHHLLDVLRLRAGDRVIVFDGAGREAETELVVLPGRREAGQPRAQLRVMGVRARAEAPATDVTLLQAIPKGTRMDWIVEKATELGVRRIRPVVTARGIVRPQSREYPVRQARWQRVADAAARQCGTAWVPEVLPVTDFSGALADARGADLFLAGVLDAAALSVHEAVQRAGAVRRAILLIGPEGDLTPAEVAEARAAGAVGITFGQRVLRVETAAIYGLSVLLTELGSGRLA